MQCYSLFVCGDFAALCVRSTDLNTLVDHDQEKKNAIVYTI